MLRFSLVVLRFFILQPIISAFFDSSSAFLDCDILLVDFQRLTPPNLEAVEKSMAIGGGEAEKSVEIGSDSKPKPSDSKLGGVGSRSGREERYFRADALDLNGIFIWVKALAALSSLVRLKLKLQRRRFEIEGKFIIILMKENEGVRGGRLIDDGFKGK